MKDTKLFTPRQAAQVLGVSYPTLKQWIYKGKIRTVKTASGHHRVPEKQLDKFLYQASEGGDVFPSYKPHFHMLGAFPVVTPRKNLRD